MAKIGILGGIGPQTTGEFYLKLILESQRLWLGKIKCGFSANNN